MIIESKAEARRIAGNLLVHVSRAEVVKCLAEDVTTEFEDEVYAEVQAIGEEL